MQDEGALIIDIRELEEISLSGKVEKAFHIPIEVYWSFKLN